MAWGRPDAVTSVVRGGCGERGRAAGARNVADEKGGGVVLSPIIKKWAPWVVAIVLAALAVFMGVKWYERDRLLREVLKAKERVEQALEGMASVEEQVRLIKEEMKKLDEKQAEIDARVRERDKRLEELERRTRQ